MLLTALNGVCPYYTMYPLDFPLRVLKRAGKVGEWVLDPFCGRGTTNFAARLLGMPSVGIDSSPVAAALAKAKLVHANPRSVVSEARAMLDAVRHPSEMPGRNRSASIRIPYVPNPKGRRIECRFPDPLCNPYLGFSAMLMAGLDGVENKIHPGEAATKDLYHLPPEEDAKIPTVCHSLDQALDYLDKDRAFLTKGGVFTDAYLDAYIELKMQEVTRFRMTTHPLEFEMYYAA